ncbi:MAG: hypothetical protein K9H84_07650 [Bacteroidales bacterium]|nr:hypothetical protein [Bacteroidales bacterium]
MNSKKFLKFYAAVLLALIASVSITAQTPQQAAETYNWAIKNYKNDIDAAIDSLEKFEKTSTQLIEEGELEGKIKEQIEQLQKKSHKHLPTLYYKSAVKLYKQRRTDMAINRFKKTVEIAKKFNNEKAVSKAQNILPKLYYKSASEATNMMDYQKAISMYSKAIEYDPEWAKAYLKKAQVYSKDGSDAKMIETVHKAIEVAKRTDDQKTLQNARRMGQTYYWRIGAKAISNSENEAALEAFNKAMDFDPQDGFSYYYTALAKNKLFKYKEAIEDGEKGLELLDAEEDKDEIAMIHLQMGIAYSSLGKTEKGCEYLKKAEYGDTAIKARKQQDSFDCTYSNP